MEQIILNLVPGGVSPVCYVSQYDVGRKIRLHLRNGSDPYVLSGAETITATIRKVSGEELIYDIANTSASYVDLIVNYDATDVIGESVCELVITQSGTRIGSANFKMRIDPDVYSGDQKLEVVSATSETPDLSFETNVEENLLELKAGFSPVQDLHGYDHPWPAGGGKNKLSTTLTNQTVRGVVLTVNADGTFTANGTATDGYSQVTVGTISLPAGDYVISDEGNFDRNNNIELYISGIPSTSTKYSDNRSFTLTSPLTNAQVFFFVGNGKSINTTIKPMIRHASESAGFAPYENICPIEGHTEANITRCGVNLWDEELVVGAIQSDGTINSGAGYTNRRTTSFIAVTPNTTYYMACPSSALIGRWATYNANKELIYFDGNGPSTNILTIGENVAYIRITLGVNYGTTYNNDISINYPSSDHDYHSYSGKLIKLEFDDTVYLAEVSCLNGVWKLKLLGAEAVFDGTETYTSFYPTVVCEKQFAKGSGTPSDMICSHAPTVAVPNQWFGYANVNNNKFEFRKVGDNWGCDDINKFKAFIAEQYSNGNPITILYPLATPTEITLDETEQFEALLGVNNIWHDANGGTEVKFFRMISAS